MKFGFRHLMLSAVLLFAFAGSASAQYLWMDTNGDGVNTAADVMSPNGTPTVVDVWINTSHNKDGSVAVCQSGDPDNTLETWNSFATHITANGGTVTYTAYTNQVAAFNIVCSGPPGGAFNSNSTDMAQCQATGTQTPNGGVNIKMYTVTVTGVTGTPSLAFTTGNALDQNPTSFGSPCGGAEFDNTIKLGTDFFDADGLGPAPGGNASPTITAPATANGTEGQVFSLSATAQDADATDNLSLTATGQPASLTLTPGSGVSPVTASLNGTFGFGDQGTYPIVWSVTDGNNPAVTATTNLTVQNVDRAPTVTAPATASGAENTLITYTVSAADPDGEPILSLAAAPLPTGASFTANASKTAGTFSWTPSFSQSGSYNVTTTASNGLSGSATTAITVTNVDRAPAVTAPATASGDENTLITFTVSASDPDSDPITSLTAAPLPSGATFTDNATHTSGTFSWTPSFTQAGAYNVTFTAANALNGSATTAITVNNVDRAPVVTAPPTASGASNSLLTFTVTASDPDGDAITSLTGAPLPTGATFTDNATHTSGTFNWTPSNAQTGTFNVTFTAANALNGSATTAITITSGDRPPVVTAPATASGDENTLITFTVSASDPDADPISSLTASPLPSGATFTDNASHTSGTFSWTPDFTQAGSTNVTFTATNALGGSATTAITVNNVDRAPVVTAPATASGDENTLITFTVTAADPDGDAIASLTGAPLPSGATFTDNAAHTSGTFSWTPSFAQAGSYNVTFTASNALNGTATTAITVTNVDRAPVVTAPPTASGQVNVLLTFTVQASDPDGDAITSLSGAPLPSGATFTPNGANTSGTFSWTPTTGQDGNYSVTFTAANALSGTATTAITIAPPGDAPPQVTAPATASGDENTLITFTVSASDPDADPIASLTAAPLPSGATFTDNATHTAGTFDWTPDFSQAGSYNVTFTATNALTGSATTAITVNNVDRAPVVSAPATASGDEGTLITFTVSASDPDGDAITSLAGAPLPSGATFTANASNTAGTFNWTPSAAQSGVYTVTFTAQNALSGSASTEITVNNVDAAPVVTAPLTASGADGTTINFTVSASDPDGDPITSLTATGTAIAAGATFTANASNTSGTFDWTSATPVGSYSVTFTASNALSGSATTAVNVTGVNHDPVVTAPATASGDEGTLITFTVSASDQDGDHVSLTMQGGPSGATFQDNGDNTGTFSWTPSFTQAGSYPVTFQGSDGNGGAGSATTAITVNDVNRAPTANAGGPYTGVINVAVSFDGSGSFDPDGDTLTYAWDFGDGGTGTGVNPSHPYSAGGTYTVTLTVTDPGTLTGTASTTATISTTLAAAAFTVGGNKTTSLGAGKPYTCVQVEAVGGSFQNGDVVLSSIKMVSAGTGSVSEILVDVTKSGIDGDKNGNGVQEILACFRKADLRQLFSLLPAGRNTVNVTIEGSLTSGATFSAPLQMIVKSTGAVLAASVSPNPLNPQAKLTFSTTKPGAVRVQMFDPQGRLVKTIAEETSVQAGYHDYTIDGRSSAGSRLASGVYFVKIWSQFDGSEVTRVTIMK